MAKRLADLSGDIDTLYQQPLTEFTAARNALAKRVRDEQGAEAAAAIKSLEKPSIPAWAVNQLYWRDRRDFDRVIKAGDSLRAAQQQRLAGHGDADALRETIEARQDAIASLVARAREIMRSAGLTLTPDMQQRIATTIEALSAYGSSDAAPRAGRLVGEVAPPGLEALALLIPAGGIIAPARAPAPTKASAKAATAPLRVVDTRRAEKAKKAKAALEEADVALARARETATDATAAQEAADAAWTAAHQALQEARRVLDEAMDSERETERARDAARREATRAAQAVERAERTRDAAEREYQAQAGE